MREDTKSLDAVDSMNKVDRNLIQKSWRVQKLQSVRKANLSLVGLSPESGPTSPTHRKASRRCGGNVGGSGGKGMKGEDTKEREEILMGKKV
jgi:hypothetical protein